MKWMDMLLVNNRTCSMVVLLITFGMALLILLLQQRHLGYGYSESCVIGQRSRFCPSRVLWHLVYLFFYSYYLGTNLNY